MSVGLEAVVRMGLEDLQAEVTPFALLAFVVACRDGTPLLPSVGIIAKSFGLITLETTDPHSSVREIVNRIATIDGETVTIN